MKEGMVMASALGLRRYLRSMWLWLRTEEQNMRECRGSGRDMGLPSARTSMWLEGRIWGYQGGVLTGPVVRGLGNVLRSLGFSAEGTEEPLKGVI